MGHKKQLFGQLLAVSLSLFLVYHYSVNYGENQIAERRSLLGNMRIASWIDKIEWFKQIMSKAGQWFKSQAANPSAVLITVLVPKSTDDKIYLCSEALKQGKLDVLNRTEFKSKDDGFFGADEIQKMLSDGWKYFEIDDDETEVVAAGGKMLKFGRKEKLADVKREYRQWIVDVANERVKSEKQIFDARWNWWIRLNYEDRSTIRVYFDDEEDARIVSHTKDRPLETTPVTKKEGHRIVQKLFDATLETFELQSQWNEQSLVVKKDPKGISDRYAKEYVFGAKNWRIGPDGRIFVFDKVTIADALKKDTRLRPE